MKKLNKFLSALLAVIMLASSFAIVTSATIPQYDEEGKLITNDEAEIDYTNTINSYLGFDGNGKKLNSFTMVYDTPQEKLASMELMWEKYGYQLWADEITGEVATVKVSTGEILFTNPWNSGDTGTNSLEKKKQVMSQIIVKYVDNDTTPTMSSCAEAASRGQINVEYIKNGIRVEYSIGREQTRMLVPKLINAERFHTKILEVMRESINEEVYITISDTNDGSIVDPYTGDIVYRNIDRYPGAEDLVGQTVGFYDLLTHIQPDFNLSGKAILDVDQYDVNRLAAYYTLKDPEDPQLTAIAKDQMIAAFPITKKMAVYVIDPNINQRELTIVENYIKTYVVSYTYEELDYDHELTEYVGTEKAPPLFKMALEYTLDQNGLSVRLPANGIRYDESLYQLEHVEMLPYMGAGANDKDFTDGGDGYTFFPDGSGALFDFEELNTGTNKSISAKVYGQDYAYHKITGTYQEAIRYPAFGIVENYTGKKTVTDYDKILSEAKYDEDGNLISPTEYATKTVTVNEKKGFLAIIEEGDALAELESVHESASTIFNTVKMKYYPRPKDSYNMSDAISVGSNTVMTVVSERKYVGSYTVRYIMLTDDGLAKENNLPNYYECSWMGMAVAYRDYLESVNILERIEKDKAGDHIPLYVETFGTLMTTEKFLSVPMDVMTPLTTFEDITTMYSELSSSIKEKMEKVAEGEDSIAITKDNASKFSNINFKLTGYANGGMYSTVPYNLNWESSVGGASGFEKLLETSKKEGFGIFPDFDFVYINSTDVFDGVSLDKHAVKTIDNRYTSRREYSATYQTYVGYFELAIAPSCFERFVTKLATNYLKYNPTGISVSTLGTDLNSDFNEDNPLNREDSKKYTVEAFKQLANLKNEDGNYLEIMTDGGNAYSWRYVDHIINMPINSSRYKDSSNAVPFIGVVLHGYVQFAGTPINEEGDIEMAMLKAIENGASIYFTLVYQNYDKFKEDMVLNKYFSVRYDIWKEDLVDMYVELNNILGDLQSKLIIDHEFLVGERIPDEDEIIADAEAEAEAERLEQLLKETEEAKKKLKEALETRRVPANSIDEIKKITAEAEEYFKIIEEYVAKFNSTANIEGNKEEYAKYISTIDDACVKLDEYRARISKAVAATLVARDKIHETWINYQNSAAQAEIDLLVYKTAFYAAKYTAEELEKLKSELDKDASELEKTACLNAIAISGKTVDELKASYEAATGADKDVAKVLYDAAIVINDNENDFELIDSKYQKIESDKVTYDKKVISYEQFYNTACGEYLTNEDSTVNLQNAFETAYKVATELANSQAVLEAKVLIYGSDKFASSELSANTSSTVLLPLLTGLEENLEFIKAHLDQIKENIAKYTAAQEAYALLLEKDVLSMSEAERKAYVSDKISLSYEIVSCKDAITALCKEIDSVYSVFTKNYSPSVNNSSILKNAIESMNKEIATAQALLAKNPANASEIQAIIANYQARLLPLQSVYEQYSAAFENIRSSALENDMLALNEKGDYYIDITSKPYKEIVATMEKKEETVNNTVVSNKYTCDDGSIVAVTYGGKDGDDDSAYRTFILNYNVFSVTVEYEGIKYELAPYAYKVINH